MQRLPRLDHQTDQSIAHNHNRFNPETHSKRHVVVFWTKRRLEQRLPPCATPPQRRRPRLPRAAPLPSPPCHRKPLPTTPRTPDWVCPQEQIQYKRLASEGEVCVHLCMYASVYVWYACMYIYVCTVCMYYVCMICICMYYINMYHVCMVCIYIYIDYICMYVCTITCTIILICTIICTFVCYVRKKGFLASLDVTGMFQSKRYLLV